MGDMADLMLDGTMCSVCGVYLGSDADYPQMCADCEKEEKEARAEDQHDETRKPANLTWNRETGKYESANAK